MYCAVRYCTVASAIPRSSSPKYQHGRPSAFTGATWRVVEPDEHQQATVEAHASGQDWRQSAVSTWVTQKNVGRVLWSFEFYSVLPSKGSPTVGCIWRRAADDSSTDCCAAGSAKLFPLQKASRNLASSPCDHQTFDIVMKMVGHLSCVLVRRICKMFPFLAQNVNVANSGRPFVKQFCNFVTRCFHCSSVGFCLLFRVFPRLS